MFKSEPELTEEQIKKLLEWADLYRNQYPPDKPNIILRGSQLKEKKFYKITNQDEKHYEFQYHEGLNELPEEEEFIAEGHCSPGGLYFTDRDNLYDFYGMGVWIREVTLPDDAIVVKINKKDQPVKYKANKLIVGPKYPLFDYRTIEKFDLGINYEMFRALLDDPDQREVWLNYLGTTDYFFKIWVGHVVSYATYENDYEILELFESHKEFIPLLSSVSELNFVNGFSFGFVKADHFSNELKRKENLETKFKIIQWWQRNHPTILEFFVKDEDVFQNLFAACFQEGLIEILDWYYQHFQQKLTLKLGSLIRMAYFIGLTNSDISCHKISSRSLDWWKDHFTLVEVTSRSPCHEILVFLTTSGLTNVLDWLYSEYPQGLSILNSSKEYFKNGLEKEDNSWPLESQEWWRKAIVRLNYGSNI